MEKTLRARCPACGKAFHAPESLAGALGRCGGCRQDFVLEAERPPIRKASARREDSRGLVLVMALILAWVVFKGLRLLSRF